MSRDGGDEASPEEGSSFRRESEPIQAPPRGALERSLEWLRRNPAKSSVAGVVLVALVVTSALLAATVRANRDLADSNRALAARTTESEARRLEAERSAAAERQRAEEVLRLSDLQDLEDLVLEADELWPARPENIARFEEWIRAGRRLVERLPTHREKLAELRAHAIPRTEEERRAERESHPDWKRLQALEGELAFRRRALLERRDGVAAERPAPDWSRFPDEASALNDVAWKLVDPARKSFGQEALGLALVRRAFERAAPGEKHVAGETLAWALFALGRDGEALQASAAALAAAPDAEKAECESTYARLERAVENASSPESLRRAERQVADLERERQALDARIGAHQDRRFPEAAERWWNAQLVKLVAALEELRDGWLSADAVLAGHGWSLPKRLALAERLRDGFAPGGEFARAWEDMLPAFHEDYPGIRLVPQVGLAPLGRDPGSGSWEFADLQTGEPPARGADGELVLTEASAVVFVLLPGGRFLMGAQRLDPSAPGYDPDARPDETPVHEVELSPYFLAKHEMTQAQWLRITGERPSHFGPGNWAPDWNRDERAPLLTHPVERVSWNECARLCRRLGFQLPSESQWEYAARGGNGAPWWFGTAAATLARAGNVADRQAAGFRSSGVLFADWDDGAAVHLPVDAKAPNPYGFHGMLGNVWEWCADGYFEDAYRVLAEPDPVAPSSATGARVRRGGGYGSVWTDSRSANRGNDEQDTAAGECGLRPARAVERR